MQILEQLASGYCYNVTEQDIFMGCASIMGYLEGCLQFNEVLTESVVMEGIDIKGILRKALDFIRGLFEKVKVLLKKLINLLKGKKAKSIDSKTANEAVLRTTPYSGLTPYEITSVWSKMRDMCYDFAYSCDYYTNTSVGILQMLFDSPAAYIGLTGGSTAFTLQDELDKISGMDENQLILDIMSRYELYSSTYTGLDFSNGIDAFFVSLRNKHRDELEGKKCEPRFFTIEEFSVFVEDHNKKVKKYNEEVDEFRVFCGRELSKLGESTKNLDLLSKKISSKGDYDRSDYLGIDLPKYINIIQRAISVSHKFLVTSITNTTNTISMCNRLFDEINWYIRNVQSKMK